MKTKMTERIFRAVKIMTAGGGTVAEIANYFNISVTTVSRVRAAETFEEYRNMLAAMHASEKKPAPPKMPEPVDAAAAESLPVNAKVPAAENLPAPAKGTPNQVVEYRQTVTVQATHYMMQEMRKTNELLDLISRKLTFIVDQLN